MKKFLLPAIIFSASVKISFGQNIAINSTGAAAAASAMLEVGTGAPDTKGLLIPRASLSTTTDLMGNASLATGLLVYNSNASMTGGWIGFWYWDGAKWEPLLDNGAPGAAWTISGNTLGATGYFIGSNDAYDVVVKSGGTTAMTISNSTQNIGIGGTPQANRRLYSTTSLAVANACGVWGEAGDATNTVYGVFGSASSSGNLAAGVRGFLGGAATPSGANRNGGTWGESQWANSYGAAGLNTSTYNTGGPYSYYGVYGSKEGNAVTGTGYGIYGNCSGTATTNYGGYFTSSGGTTNIGAYITGTQYGFLVPSTSGNCGIGLTTPNEQLEITKNFRFPVTTGSTVGVIMQGADRFIHNYSTTGNTAPASGTVGPNLFVGYQAGNFTLTGGNNTGIGYQALSSITSGFLNVGVGLWACNASATCQNNTGIGAQALESNTAGFNTAVGMAAFSNNVTGTRNVSIGEENLTGISSGNNNTNIGSLSGFYSLSLTTAGGSDNTAIGYKTLFSNTAAGNNTAIGSQAMSSTNTGTDNVAVGYQSDLSNTSGTKNAGVGSGSLPGNSTGSNNSAIGYHAGWGFNVTNTSCIGYTAGGNFAGSTTNWVEIGNTSNTTIGGQVAWSTLSDARIKDNVKENVPGLAFINLLHPVTYNLNIHRQNEMASRLNGKKDTAFWPEKYDIEKIRQTGFIAQEVEKAAKETGFDFSGVGIPADPSTGLYSLRYSDFVMPLVKAVQELNIKNESQQKIIEELQKKVLELENKIDKK